MAQIKAQVNGTMTVIGSKNYEDSLKNQVLAAGPNGEVREFRKVLVDPKTGEEVVIKGKARLSSGGKDKTGPKSLTCSIMFKLNNIESLLVEPNKKEELSADDLAAQLGIG